MHQCAGLATALNPYIDDENSIKVAREAWRSGRSVADLVLAMGLLDQATLDSILRPDVLTAPHRQR